MQQLAYSGQRSSAGQVQALQGRLMTITRQVETQRNEFRQLGCDRAAVRDTSQCQQWLDEMYQMEQSIKSYRAGMLRCGDNRSCITRHQNAMKATAGKSQRLSSQLQSQCRK